jgi:drug/metabolite transporter (DMT)-like permease
MAAVSCTPIRGRAEANVQDRRAGVVRHAPVAGVALVAAGAAMWGLDGGLRAPLVTGAGPGWSPWTIVLYEHVVLTSLVGVHVWRNRAQLRRLDGAGWLSALAIAWGGSAIATLAFTDAFRFGNPDVVVLLQKTQPLWAMGAALVVVGERPRRAVGAFLAPAAIGRPRRSPTAAPEARWRRCWPQPCGEPPQRSAGGRCATWIRAC